MKALILAGALMLGAAPAAAAQPMTAGEFLARAEPLMKKSKAALIFSGEARKLIRVIGEAAERNRARHEAERAAGRKLTSCLPPKGKAKVDANELLAHLRAIPPQQRGQSFDQAFGSLMARKYPCKA